MLIAGVTLLCIIAALGLGQARHTSYTADTTVIVYPVAGTAYAQESQSGQLVDLTTEAQVVRSDAVARLAQQQLTTEGYDKLTVAGLISRVKATVETNTQVLRISYDAGAPRRARDGADAFAAAYLANRQKQAQDAAAKALSEIADSRARSERALSLQQRILSNTSTNSSAYGTIKAQIKATQGTLADLRAQEADWRKRPVLPGEVLSPATLPSAPSGTGAGILVGLGLVIGLVVGTVIAALRERAVGPIRKASALPSDPPVLAVVPPMRRVSEPVVLTNSAHRAAEAYRLLYLAVDATLPRAHMRGNVIAVCSLTDPAPPVAVNLAVAMAEAGRTTTFVDALPPRSAPRLPGLELAAGSPGLADALLSGVDAVASRQNVAARLTVLSAGNDLDRAAALYGGPRTRRIFDALRQAADAVIVAAPPLTDPDGQALASVADAVVIVAPIGSATFDNLTAAVTEAGRVHARVLGVVATHPASGSAAAPPPPVKPAEAANGDEQSRAAAGWVPS